MSDFFIILLIILFCVFLSGLAIVYVIYSVMKAEAKRQHKLNRHKKR